MKQYLRVKIKSLAEEAKIIRKEEDKVRDKTSVLYLGLKNHRKQDVRKESRAALIAYGYINGLAYKQIEGKNKKNTKDENPHIWKRVYELVSKYGKRNRNLYDEISEWRNA